MDPVGILRRWFGRDADDGSAYRCIRCGDEFEANHRECPTCGRPYVTEIEE